MNSIYEQYKEGQSVPLYDEPVWLTATQAESIYGISSRIIKRCCRSNTEKNENEKDFRFMRGVRVSDPWLVDRDTFAVWADKYKQNNKAGQNNLIIQTVYQRLLDQEKSMLSKYDQIVRMIEQIRNDLARIEAQNKFNLPFKM